MPFKSLDEILEENPNDEISIVFVGDINLIKEPYYYKVILECKKENGYHWYHTVDVPPEQLHKRYKVGALFKNGKQIGYRNDISIASFEIDPNIGQLYQIGNILNSSDEEIISRGNTYNYVLQQNCYLFEFTEYDLIIPHYTIANHFHFRSSSLKHAILDKPLNSLYEPNSFKVISEDKVSINIKTSTNQCDLKTICNFLYPGTSHTKNSFNYYFMQRTQVNKYGNCQIEAKFPISNTFSIKGICKQVNTEGKTKILLLGIYQDNYKYPFKEIDYYIDKAKGKGIQGVNTPSFKKEIPTESSGRIVNKTPSAKYIIKNKIFIEEDFNDINEIRLNPIIMDIEGKTPLKLIAVKKTVDGSFEPAQEDGDENIQQETLATDDSKEKTQMHFSFDDFEKLFKELINRRDIKNAILYAPAEMKPKPNKKKNKIARRYYISDELKRSYLYGNFMIKDKVIVFLEIEQGGAWKKITTWFFILTKDNQTGIEKFCDKILEYYLTHDINLEDIKDKLLKEESIIFIRKKHPDLILTDESIRGWGIDTEHTLSFEIRRIEE